jgi:hypothetical protein
MVFTPHRALPPHAMVDPDRPREGGGAVVDEAVDEGRVQSARRGPANDARERDMSHPLRSPAAKVPRIAGPREGHRRRV